MPENELETHLGVLNLLSDALTMPHSLDEGLEHIVKMTCELMGTAQTAVLLRDEERREFIVHTCCGINVPTLRLGAPLDVPERLKSILWKNRHIHQINWVDSGIENIGFPILVVPLAVRGERVGLLITGKSCAELAGFSPVRRRIYRLIATFASLVIENAKVYDYLRQQFAQRSQELAHANREDAGTRDEAHQLMVSSLNNPCKVVRLLSQSFYKELRRAGFSADHITTAAAYILECITTDDDIR